MATYKVLQDVEAEDKIVGPLTLWQFIYAMAFGLLGWLSVVSVMKNVPFLLIILVPPALFALFLAFPWGKDQPTEVWALAKLRFFLMPRKRIWSQDGMTDLVTVTAPKKPERVLTDGLSQHEVRSRLSALASTIDSRGWVVKNMNINLSDDRTATYVASDRLVDMSGVNQEVSNLDINPDDDVLDENNNPLAHNLDAMISQAAANHHKQLITSMQQPLAQQSVPAYQNYQAQDTTMTPASYQPSILPPVVNPTSPIDLVTTDQTSSVQPQAAGYWFMPQTSTQPQNGAMPMPGIISSMDDQFSVAVPQAAVPTPDEQALLEHIKHENAAQEVSYSHLKILKTPEQLAEEARIEAAKAAEEKAKAAVTSEKQAAIINLARSNDLNISTLKREADRVDNSNNEVVISLR